MILALYGFLFAICRELSEHAKENKFTGYPDWWNTAKSWQNKHNWRPSWLFKTGLVWSTDAEHFFQLLSMVAVLFAVMNSSGDWYSVGYFYAGNVLAGFMKIFTKIS